MERIYGDCGHLLEWGDDVEVMATDDGVAIIHADCDEHYAEMCNCDVEDFSIVWEGQLKYLPEKYAK